MLEGHDALAIEKRRALLEGRRKEGLEGVFRAQALALPLPPSFHDALRVPRASRAVIAEIVRTGAEESGPDFGALAAQLEGQGASALCIDTDEFAGKGGYADILGAAQACSLPILARDIVLDPLQITMARAHGASAVLLPAALHEERDFRALFRHALDIGLDVVAQVRSMAELDMIRRVRTTHHGDAGGVRMVAVSPLDPVSGEVDRELPERLVDAISDHAVRILDLRGVCDEQAEAFEDMGFEAFFCARTACLEKVVGAEFEQLLHGANGQAGDSYQG